MILACQKLLGQITKVLGMRRPPPYVEKNSQIIPYFFSDAFPNALQLIHILLTGKPSYHCSTIRECAVVFLTSASYSGEGPDGFIGTEGALGIDSPAQRFPTHPPIH